MKMKQNDVYPYWNEVFSLFTFSALIVRDKSAKDSNRVKCVEIWSI